ncbi:MAG: hypothetical protein U9N12_06390 [Euryarchaeota archaeon]|nr:hypothetical protein [Euryarchaeota archaeon]
MTLLIRLYSNPAFINPFDLVFSHLTQEHNHRKRWQGRSRIYGSNPTGGEYAETIAGKIVQGSTFHTATHHERTPASKTQVLRSRTVRGAGAAHTRHLVEW